MQGKLKNITNIFRRYKNPYISLDKRFIAPEKRSVKLESLYSKSLQNTSFGSYLDYIKATAFSKITDVDNAVTTLLDVFTGEEYPDEFFHEFSKYQQSLFPEILEINTEDRNKINIKLINDREINAHKLSFLYPKIAEYYPEVLDRHTRKGDCHTMAVKLAGGLDNTLIATGSIYTLLSRAKYLHSWVEKEDEDSEKYCLDFTYNIALKQKDYYDLFHVKLYEKITPQQFTDDLDDLKKLFNANHRYSKLYLSSREEALEIAKTLPEVSDDMLL